MAKSDLIKAAIAFREWQKPWTFDSVVLNQLSDDSEGQTMFRQIWAEACRSDKWQQVIYRNAAVLAIAGSRMGFHGYLMRHVHNSCEPRRFNGANALCISTFSLFEQNHGRAINSGHDSQRTPFRFA
ncbi:hypothetical protein [Paraburkholderia dilworthii]|uniref:hypothetical protein n=1 Tax=Paraburkholderia dilworthii TaxID=948106 RepID=UPI001FCB54F2|nr:hypothetical protein [Paraburkholderia dilworthii]